MPGKEFPPILKINFIPDIESTGAKEGFLKIGPGPTGKAEAKYNNYGRFHIMTNQVLVPSNGERRVIPWAEYKEGGKDAFPEVKTSKFGISGFIRLRDFDHGHEMTWFLNANSQEPTKLSWIADALQKEMDAKGLSEETGADFVFEIGKRKAKQGAMGTFYLKYLGTTEDITLLENPAALKSAARKESILENQKAAPANDEIQNFILSDDETFIMQQINQLVSAKKGFKVGADRLQNTFETGFQGRKTNKSRASYIATHAKDLGYKGEIET